MKKLCLIIFGVILVVSSTAMAGIYRVDRDIVGGTGDGSSWADAYSDLQSAIEAAAVAPYGPHEVWVKAGTYKPNDPDPSNTSREQWFQLKNGVAVYGGFAGGEDLRAARDFEANETILSGDIGTEGDISDNCYHVFNHPDGSNLDATAILDGVTVTGGNANHVDDTHDHAYGGGMVNRRSSPTLRNCIIKRNYVRTWGGGMYNYQSSPTLTNCTIYANVGGTGVGVCNNYRCSPVFTNCTISTNYSADGAGGAMYNREQISVTMTNCKVSTNTARSTGGIYQQGGSTLTMTNCVIEDCMSSAGDGAGVYSNSSTVNLTNCTISGCRGRYGGAFCLLAGSATLTNCTIAGNEATGRGGAMMIDSCSPVLTNCTFYLNNAPAEGAIRIYTSYGAASPVLTNCILWDNGIEITGGTPVVRYCVVRGGAYTTDGNTGDDPNISTFAYNGGLGRTMALGSGSSAIDAGDPASTLTEDQRGAPRPQGGRVDVGAYETGSNCIVRFVTADDSDAVLMGTTTQTVGFGKPCSSVRVFPSEGYRLVNWTYGGGTVLSTDTTVTAQGFTTDMTVTANLSNEYAITSSVVGNGTISPASATVNYANSQVCTITPDADHRIVDVQVDGVSVGPVSSYGFIGVATDHEIRAIFEAIPAYTVTFTPESGGTITGDSPQTILEGNDCTEVEAVPNPGYHFVNWTRADDSVVSIEKTITVEQVSENMILTAHFQLTTYEITTSVTGSGSISPATATVNQNDNQTFTITPEPDYQIVDVQIDGVSVGIVDSYTFTNVVATHSVSAIFSRIVGPDLPVIVSPSSGDTDVILTPEIIVEYMETAEIETHLLSEWQIASDADFSEMVFNLTSETFLTELTVTDMVLKADNVYYWRVRFIDTDSYEWEWSETGSFTTAASSIADADGNLIPDDMEINPTSDLDGNGEADISQPGMYCITLPDAAGEICISVQGDSRTLEALSIVDPTTIEDMDNLPAGFPLGLFSFRINLPEKDGYAKVTVWFSEPLPENTLWYKYDSVNGWQDFSDYATFNEEMTSVTLFLIDGWFGDADGVSNGIIVDPSGPVFDLPQTTADEKSGGGGGCFIDGLTR